MEKVSERLWSWAAEVDDGAIRQASAAARLPIVEDHVALMPDAHVGIGATVGSVIPTRNAVIPSAVGVDIGCGMVAARLDVTAAQLPDSLDPLLPRVEKAVPAGVGKGHDTSSRGAERWLRDHEPATQLTPKQARTALAQLGSLGAGNHFFEVCLDEVDRVWVVLHSGSRGIGNQLAQQHIGRARRLSKDLGRHLEDPDLAWFTQGTPEFETYIADLTEQMGGRAWLADRAASLVDEIPSAYKDIDQVMAAQSDLVEVEHTLHQILNYKGV